MFDDNEVIAVNTVLYDQNNLSNIAIEKKLIV
jgi:hypothetical protein